MFGALILAAAMLASPLSVAGGARTAGSGAAEAEGPAAPAPVTSTIGRSVRGRAIRATRIGDGSAAVVVVGCVHGNERAGRAVIERLRAATAPAGVALWLIDLANPDGCRANTRQNANGVDLNRNFPYRWRALPRGTYHSGLRALSEPESRALHRFLRRVGPAISIWYHQHARLVDAYGDERPARRYASLVGLPYKLFYAAPGSITRWQVQAFPRSTGMVVELPPGALSSSSARRHARAVLALAQGAA